MNLSIKPYFNLLSKYLKKQKWRFFCLALILVCGIALQIISPQIVRKFIDTAMKNGSDSTLIKMAVL